MQGATAMQYANVYGAAIGAASQVGQSAITGALGGASVSGGGKQDLSTFMDGSGWTVSTGGGRSTATATGGGGRTSSDGEPSVLAGMGLSPSAVLIAAAGVLVVVLILRKRKGA